VRPWGFWKPVYEKTIALDPDFKANKNFKRDMLNVAVGVVWQMSMLVMPVYLVFKNFINFGIALVVFLATTVFIKFNWWDKLED
jgi:hypothetical protein